MTKPVKRVDLSKLSPEQRAALGQFLRDSKRAAPQVEEMRQTAQQVFAHLLKTPEWQLAEAEPPQGERPQESLWHVGAPEVNYVDHIERPK